MNRLAAAAMGIATMLVVLSNGCGEDAEAEYMVPDAYKDMLGAYRVVRVGSPGAKVEVTRLYVQIVDYTAESWTLSYRLWTVNSLAYDVNVSATIWWRTSQEVTLAISNTAEVNLVRARSEDPMEGIVVIATPLAEQLDPDHTDLEWTWRGVNL